MDTFRDLNERERLILHAVVHSYITTAEPVGSRTVVKRFDLDLSPATVRNVMADLEELGYLQQIHTSSGRVPTEQGYQYYVEHLMRVQELTLSERTRIDQEYSQKLSDADAVLRHTSHLLALVTHQAGIAEGPRDSSALVRRIELMPVTETRMAVLIVDNFGRVHSLTIHLGMPLTTDKTRELTRFLNDHLAGTTIDTLASAMEEKLRTFLDEQRQLAELALAVLRMLPPPARGQLYLEGAAHLFEQPEFRDIERVRQVFGLFEEQDRLKLLLRRAVTGAETKFGTVVIGTETEVGGVDGISVIAAPYEVGGQPVGMIGVLGPRRMPYPRLTAIVDYTAGMVSRILTRLSG